MRVKCLPGLASPRLLNVGRDGALAGHTGTKRSLIADLKGLFAHAEAFNRLVAERGSDLAYEVHEFRPERVAPHELVFGTSTLQAGKVGDEFFMTRGHIHTRTDRPEIYFCHAGRGVMHMEAPDGDDAADRDAAGLGRLRPRRSGFTAASMSAQSRSSRRSAIPADAGQDYDIIERSGGMRTLIVEDGDGGWAEERNPRYRPRSEAEQRRYLTERAG